MQPFRKCTYTGMFLVIKINFLVNVSKNYLTCLKVANIPHLLTAYCVKSEKAMPDIADQD